MRNDTVVLRVDDVVKHLGGQRILDGVSLTVKKGRLSVWEMTEETRAQIWAEAMLFVAEGETTYLDYELEREAARMQLNALEFDEHVVNDAAGNPLEDDDDRDG